MSHTEKDKQFTQTILNIQDIGFLDNFMEMESLLGQMILGIKEVMWMGKSKVREHSNTHQRRYILVTGMVENNKEKELCIQVKVQS